MRDPAILDVATKFVLQKQSSREAMDAVSTARRGWDDSFDLTDSYRWVARWVLDDSSNTSDVCDGNQFSLMMGDVPI